VEGFPEDHAVAALTSGPHPERGPSYTTLADATVTAAEGREVRCTQVAGHSPAEDIHQGLLEVTLPDGREVAASLEWSTSPTPRDEDNLRRAG
jgi:hypothetical protein